MGMWGGLVAWWVESSVGLMVKWGFREMSLGQERSDNLEKNGKRLLGCCRGVISVLSLIITVEDLNNIFISQYVEHVITMEEGEVRGGKQKGCLYLLFYPFINFTDSVDLQGVTKHLLILPSSNSWSPQALGHPSLVLMTLAYLIQVNWKLD